MEKKLYRKEQYEGGAILNNVVKEEAIFRKEYLEANHTDLKGRANNSRKREE